MKFKNVAPADLVKKIANDLKLAVFPFPGAHFFGMKPHQSTPTLKHQNHLNRHAEGAFFYTKLLESLRANAQKVNQAKQKLIDATVWNEYPYDNHDASLKMHISINEMGEVDEEVIYGLFNLLKQESEDKNNNACFHFKTVNPANLNKRFQNNDQITIYFDKYSSITDFVKLADKIEKYLLANHIPKNKIPLGPKDKFSLNSFVSARFDANKLHKNYDIHQFYDIEIKKFFEAHKNNLPLLKNMPLSTFEVVFNNIITSKNINIKNRKSDQSLSDEDSRLVQNEFAKIMNLPIKDNFTSKIQEFLAAKKPNLLKEKYQLVVNPLEDHKRAIERLRHDLAKEITRLESFACSLGTFFFAFEIETKKTKLAALTQLNNAASLNELVDLATPFLSNKRIMRSMKTSRTRDLLLAIIATPPETRHPRNFRGKLSGIHV